METKVVEAIITKDEGQFVIHGLFFSIVNWSSSEEDLKKKFMSGVASYIHCTSRHGEIPFKDKREPSPDNRKIWENGEPEIWDTFGLKNVRDGDVTYPINLDFEIWVVKNY